MKQEQGAFLVIMMLGVVALLAVAGLAVDIANVLYAKIQLQKSADAAVAAGLEYRLVTGPIKHSDLTQINTNYDETTVESRAQDIAKHNLLLNLRTLDKSDSQTNGINTNVADFKVEQDIDAANRPIIRESLEITLNAKIKFLILGMVPFEMLKTASLGKTTNINSYSKGNIRPARVVLMLDFSSSMSCPITFPKADDPFKLPFIPYDQSSWESLQSYFATGPQPNPFPSDRVSYDNFIRSYTYCSCQIEQFYNPFHSTPTINPACNPLKANSKFTILLDSVYNFLKYFQTGRDRISIIPFNLSSKVYHSLHNSFLKEDLEFWDPANNSGIKGKTGEMGEWTNPSDALIAAYQDAVSSAPGTPSNIPDKETYYVLFSDGAPTAGRFSLRYDSYLRENNSLASYEYFNPITAEATAKAGLNTSALKESILYSLSNPPKKLGNNSILFPYWTMGEPLVAPAYGQNNTLYSATLSNLSTLASNFKQSNCTATPIANVDTGVSNFCKCTGNDLTTCTGKFDYAYFPDNTADVYTSDPTYRVITETPTGPSIRIMNNSYIENYYKVAIAYADQIRQKRGRVFTIGLGPDPKATDAYQDITDAQSRKDYFLSRVAFASNISPSAKLDFTDLPTWTSLEAAAVKERKGLYFPTNDANSLRDAFDSLGKYLSRITK